MERDALLVQKDTLEDILAKAEAERLTSVKELLNAILSLCPPVNRQLASAAEHLLEALEGLMESLNQNDRGGWVLCEEPSVHVDGLINAAELALVMAYGEAGRGKIGTSVAHQLKDANAAVGIQHEQIEGLLKLVADLHHALDRCRQLMEDTGVFRLDAGCQLESDLLDIMTRMEARQ